MRLTHTHADHLSGVRRLAQRTGATVLAHAASLPSEGDGTVCAAGNSGTTTCVRADDSAALTLAREAGEVRDLRALGDATA